jgi:predicted ATP-dependent serine protease
LEELVEELERSHSTPTQRIYNASEFFAQETAALEWIVPGLLPVGETALLASIAKVGKTGLITDIIHAVLAGETVVGEQVGVKGKVLFITSDESHRTTRRRLRARGIDLLAEVDNLHIMPHLDITKLSELEAELEDFQPQLVVIDSLTTYLLITGSQRKRPRVCSVHLQTQRLIGSLQRSRHYYTSRE